MSRSIGAALVAAAILGGIAGLAQAQVTSDDSIYFIMTDRFYDGDESNNYRVRVRDLRGYHGGDFAGIIEKLDYIRDLGFTAIWISPVVDNQSGGYHGYYAQDFYAVEEHFGSMDDLKRLVEEAHRRGIKVIVDLVVNHTGLQHPYVSDPAYADWFHPRRDIRDFGNQEEVENNWLAGLPDLAQENPEVREYLIQMALWWIDQTGIDGYRLDTVRHVPRDFWEEFAAAIHERYPDFYLVGETFDGDVSYVGSYQRTGIDGMLDFPLYFPVRSMITQGEPAGAVATAMRQAAGYPDRAQMGTFIDNHDVARFVHQLRRYEDEKMRQGLLFLFTYTGIPAMYYGTEIPIDGGADHGNRRDMVWDEPGRYVGLVRRLNGLRASNPALTRGEFRLLDYGGDYLAYARFTDNQALVTVLATHEDPSEFQIELPEEWSQYRSARALVGTEGVFPVRRNTLKLELPAYTGALVELSEERPPLSVPWWGWATLAGSVLGALGLTFALVK